MKFTTRLFPLAATVLAAGLAGCAHGPAKGGDHSHAMTGPMDMQSHCEMHRTSRAGKSPGEQQAMMQEHMKSIAPEMRQRMQAMHAQCS